MIVSTAPSFRRPIAAPAWPMTSEMTSDLCQYEWFTIWCFINKVREEHVQIINLINTRGEQSVINPVNKIRGVYIYTADLPLFIGSFPASLRHPFSALTTIPVLICRGVLWVRAKIPSSEPSPRTARQIRINFLFYLLYVSVNSWSESQWAASCC